MNLAVAIALAAEVFKETHDKGGEPYILHCLRVMDKLHTRDKELQTIAILHDVLEDSNLVEEDLRKLGFSPRVIIGVRFLTHDPAIPYDDYIKALASHEDARLVKLADLRDNSDITRLKGLTKKDLDRMEVYHRAYIYLSKV